MSSKGKVNALSIIALIIGASGLGIGAFSIIRFQLVEGPIGPEAPEGPPGDDGSDGSNGIDGTLDNLVGFWASMNQTNFGLEFNITFHDNRFIDTSYVSMSDNENFALIQEGWYRLTVLFFCSK
ncbi:MAG: collagen-like triple helix repeat-containing protein [Promethearchaeota archaeon]